MDIESIIDDNQSSFKESEENFSREKTQSPQVY